MYIRGKKRERSRSPLRSLDSQCGWTEVSFATPRTQEGDGMVMKRARALAPGVQTPTRACSAGTSGRSLSPLQTLCCHLSDGDEDSPLAGLWWIFTALTVVRGLVCSGCWERSSLPCAMKPSAASLLGQNLLPSYQFPDPSPCQALLWFSHRILSPSESRSQVVEPGQLHF